MERKNNVFLLENPSDKRHAEGGGYTTFGVQPPYTHQQSTLPNTTPLNTKGGGGVSNLRMRFTQHLWQNPVHATASVSLTNFLIIPFKTEFYLTLRCYHLFCNSFIDINVLVLNHNIWRNFLLIHTKMISPTVRFFSESSFLTRKGFQLFYGRLLTPSR